MVYNNISGRDEDEETQEDDLEADGMVFEDAGIIFGTLQHCIVKRHPIVGENAENAEDHGDDAGDDGGTEDMEQD